MIKDLGCAKLTRRRESTLTLIYKLTHGLIDEDSGEYLMCHMQIKTFFPKPIADWNCLPEAIVSPTSLETFQYRLSAFLKKKLYIVV